jgi:hypothetical protein
MFLTVRLSLAVQVNVLMTCHCSLMYGADQTGPRSEMKPEFRAGKMWAGQKLFAVVHQLYWGRWPEFKPLYREERVDLGLYAADTPEVVVAELAMAAGLFARTFATLEAEQLAREVQYTYPVVATRTVLWMAQQAVHEVEHHHGDVEAGQALLAP